MTLRLTHKEVRSPNILNAPPLSEEAGKAMTFTRRLAFPTRTTNKEWIERVTQINPHHIKLHAGFLAKLKVTLDGEKIKIKGKGGRTI